MNCGRLALSQSNGHKSIDVHHHGSSAFVSRVSLIGNRPPILLPRQASSSSSYVSELNDYARRLKPLSAKEKADILMQVSCRTFSRRSPDFRSLADEIRHIMHPEKAPSGRGVKGPPPPSSLGGFAPSEVASMFLATARLWGIRGGPDLRPLARTLASALGSVVEDLPPSDICEVLWAAARTTTYDEALLLRGAGALAEPGPAPRGRGNTGPAPRISQVSTASASKAGWAVAKLASRQGSGLHEDRSRMASDAAGLVLGALADDLSDPIRCSSLTSQDTSMVLWAFATAGIRPSRDVLTGLASTTERGSNNLNSQAISNIVWAFSRLGGASNSMSLLETLADCAPRFLQTGSARPGKPAANQARRRDRFSAQELANILGGFSSLGYNPGPLLEGAEAFIVDNLDEFNAQDLSEILLSYAALGQAPYSFSRFKTILARFDALVPDSCTPQQLSKALWAVAKLKAGRLFDPEILPTGLEARWAQQVEARLGEFLSLPLPLTRSLWALSVLRALPSSTLNRVAAAIGASGQRRPLIEYSSQSLSILLWCFAKNEHSSGSAVRPVLECVGAELELRGWDTLEPKNTAQILWAFAKLGFFPDPSQLGAAAEHMASVAPKSNLQSLLLTTWALGVLGFCPEDEYMVAMMSQLYRLRGGIEPRLIGLMVLNLARLLQVRAWMAVDDEDEESEGFDIYEDGRGIEADLELEESGDPNTSGQRVGALGAEVGPAARRPSGAAIGLAFDDDSSEEAGEDAGDRELPSFVRSAALDSNIQQEPEGGHLASTARPRTPSPEPSAAGPDAELWDDCPSRGAGESRSPSPGPGPRAPSADEGAGSDALDQILDTIVRFATRVVTTKAPFFTPQALSNLAFGLARLRRSHFSPSSGRDFPTDLSRSVRTALVAIASEVSKRPDAFSYEECTQLWYSVARLSPEDRAVTAPLFSALAERTLGPVGLTRSDFSPSSMATLLWAAATVGYDPGPQVVPGVLSAVTSNPQHYRAYDLIRIMWGLTDLGLIQPGSAEAKTLADLILPRVNWGLLQAPSPAADESESSDGDTHEAEEESGERTGEASASLAALVHGQFQPPAADSDLYLSSRETVLFCWALSAVGLTQHPLFQLMALTVATLPKSAFGGETLFETREGVDYRVQTRESLDSLCRLMELEAVVGGDEQHKGKTKGQELSARGSSSSAAKAIRVPTILRQRADLAMAAEALSPDSRAAERVCAEVAACLEAMQEVEGVSVRKLLFGGHLVTGTVRGKSFGVVPVGSNHLSINTGRPIRSALARKRILGNRGLAVSLLPVDAWSSARTMVEKERRLEGVLSDLVPVVPTKLTKSRGEGRGKGQAAQRSCGSGGVESESEGIPKLAALRKQRQQRNAYGSGGSGSGS